MPATFPSPPASKTALEFSETLTPRFDTNGLLTAVVTDAVDGELLMVAHMDAAALDQTLRTGLVHFYSRSRKALWKKGETSGNVLTVHEMRVDCDQDAIWLKVSVGGDGVTCHTGARSCFYRTVDRRADGTIELKALDAAPTDGED